MVKNFSKIYANLNEQQRLAVDTIEGPVMVIAGPGTGKTQVLAARIANILEQTDENPGSILALTFTDSAAKNMRERLYQMIGKAAYKVRIQTFHSFAEELIKSHPDYFPFQTDAQALSDLELNEFLSQTLEDSNLRYLRSYKSAFHFLYAVKSALQNIKREGLLVDQYRELVEAEKDLFEHNEKLSKSKQLSEEKRIGRMEELVLIYEKYQKFLSENNRYDFEDMILQAVSALKNNEDLLRDYQEQIHYFLVDEYQDTNSAQNQIVDLLASYWGDSANVFVVGDPNQTIYRFQGASFENILGFVKRYPQVQVITLEKGYRCPQEIYDVAAKTISQMKSLDEAPEIFTVLKRALTSAKLNAEDFQSIRVIEASTDTVERLETIDRIKSLLNQGVEPEEIAILYKKHKEAVDLIEALESQEIPYQLEKTQNILDSVLIQQIILALKIVAKIQRGETIYDLHELLLFDWLGLDSFAVLKAISQSTREKQNLYDYLQTNDSNVDESIKQTVDKLKNLAAFEKNHVFLEFIVQFFTDLGLLDYLKNSNDRMAWQLLRSFYDEIKIFINQDKKLNLEKFIKILDLLQNQGIGIKKKILLGSKSGVVLSTAHGAKGKEWKHVFLINLVDGNWGNSRAPFNISLPSGILKFNPETKQDKQEDERRLFYVAVTRAKESLTLTYPKLDERTGKENLISEFGTEIEDRDERLEIREAGNKNLINYEDDGVDLLFPTIEPDKSNDFKVWLQELVNDFVWSPTALDIFLKDKREFLFNNLLKIPRAKNAPLAFGTAAHSTLEYVFRHGQKTGKLLDSSLINDFFVNALEKEVLSESEYQSRLLQGKEVLSAYFDKLDSDFNFVKSLEYSFGWKSRPIILDKQIHLSGKIDRVDYLDDSKKHLKIVDYKTGSLKSKNDIEAKTKTAKKLLSEAELVLPESIRGRYKRQLVFYKLLTQLDPSFSGEVKLVELDFIEAPSKNKKGKIQFEITEQEIEDLKTLLRQVDEELKTLNFIKS